MSAHVMEGPVTHPHVSIHIRRPPETIN